MHGDHYPKKLPKAKKTYLLKGCLLKDTFLKLKTFFGLLSKMYMVYHSIYGQYLLSADNIVS